ncbi:hypothetical protein B0H34DRAFT_536958 [Crassisporium funariophilum]|nr:hypothetical protein B0H34DRAFT_536958 [Crassisporium funariophilum]
MFAYMALRCLKSAMEHSLFLNQYSKDRDYHLGLLDYEPHKNQGLPTMAIQPEGSTLDYFTETFLRCTVAPLMKEASRLQELLDLIYDPKVKVLLDNFIIKDSLVHEVDGEGEYHNKFKEYVRRCHLTPVNLFDLQPIVTSPDGSRLLRSLLEFALPQQLRYS